MEFWPFLFDIVLLLGAAMLVGGILSRFGQSPLVGYLLAGMLIGGPGSLNLISSPEEIETIAELGISLLLFGLGLEFSWHRLRRLGSRILYGGGLQVVVTLIVVMIGARCFGLPLSTSFAVGAMVAVSSTACVLRVLIEQAEIDSAHGRASLGVLLVQDIAVVVLAIFLALIAQEGSATEVIYGVVKIVVLTAFLVATLYLLVNKLAVFLLGAFTLERNRELAILMAITIGLGSAWAAHSAGISPALGAFVAGMFLGSSPFSVQVRADIASLRVILLTLFFGAAGMVADPVWIFSNLTVVLSLTLLLIVTKVLIIWLLFIALGFSASLALAVGLSLGQVGEFAFVLGDVAHTQSLLPDDVYLLIVSCAILTLFLTPYMVAAAPRVSLKLASMLRRNIDDSESNEISEKWKPEIVVIGFGPAGQMAIAELVDCHERILVLDLNRVSIEKAISCGVRAKLGDASSEEVLREANVASASIVVVTLPSKSAGLQVVRNIRALAPKARIIVRSRYQRFVDDFLSIGADIVVGDEEQAGFELSKKVNALRGEFQEI